MKLIILLQIIININHGHENKKVFCLEIKLTIFLQIININHGH